MQFHFTMLQTRSRAVSPRTGLETALEKSRTALCRMAKSSAECVCSCITAPYRYKCTVMSNRISRVQWQAVLPSICVRNRGAIVEPVSEAHPRQRRPPLPSGDPPSASRVPLPCGILAWLGIARSRAQMTPKVAETLLLHGNGRTVGEQRSDYAGGLQRPPAPG